MKAVIQQKVNDVNAMVEDLKDASCVLAFEYHGVPASLITKTRRILHEAKAKMYVAKNNIYNRAFSAAGIKHFNELSGPNAIIISHGDEIVPFKQIHELIAHNKKVVYKKGIIGSTIIEADKLASLASIPSRDGLYSMLLSCLQAPIRNFLYGIKAVDESKPQ